MRKQIDWNAEAAKAKKMTNAQLWYAQRDAAETARLWNNPDTDPDGNYGFYMDQASVYSAERKRRRNA
jgi:hypothetical protein